jgi:hypothetical protein
LVASVQALPSQGMTAIPWAVVAEPDKDGRGGRLTAKLRVPGQVVGEGVRIALKSLAGM